MSISENDNVIKTVAISKCLVYLIYFSLYSGSTAIFIINTIKVIPAIETPIIFNTLIIAFNVSIF